MQPLNLAQTRPASALADVALPQTYPFGELSYHFGHLSAKLYLGRTQAAFTSQKGAAQSTPPQNKWSRGCRARKSQFLPFAWSASLLHALKRQKKLSMLTSLRLAPNPSIPANTSNLIGRALLALAATPALFLSAPLIPFAKEGSAC